MHQWAFAGHCERRLHGDGETCERPHYLECQVCSAREVVRCDATREDRCGPCGRRHGRRLRRLIRSGFTGRSTGFFLGTATAPGQHRTENGADGVPGKVGQRADRLKAAWWKYESLGVVGFR